MDERSLRRLLAAAVLGIVAGSLAACANTPIGEQVERSLAADPRLTQDEPVSPPSRNTGTRDTPSSSSPPSDVSSRDRLTPPEFTASDSTVNGLVDSAGQRLGLRLDSLSASDVSAVSEASEAMDSAFVDLADAPEDLQPYLVDLAALDLLTPADDSADDPALVDNVDETEAAVDETESVDVNSENVEATADERRDRLQPSVQFQPNQPIRRRDFARWLLTANNALFGDRPSQRLRSGSVEQPAFQDVPPSDPDFAIIQGLAEAGMIASPLSGQATQVNFRPDAPLTRETALRWKVPLDYRQPLPVASVAAVEETWGFQDATQIDPDALPAVLADYQNGDAANIRRAFGYTTLLQPKRTVTRAEAAAMVWYFGYQGDGRSAQQLLVAQAAAGEESPATLGYRLGDAIAPVVPAASESTPSSQ